MSRKELVKEELEKVAGGYVGWDWDIDSMHGTCGLGTARTYEFTDKAEFERILGETEGQGDVARIKALLDAGVIKTIK